LPPLRLPPRERRLPSFTGPTARAPGPEPPTPGDSCKKASRPSVGGMCGDVAPLLEAAFESTPVPADTSRPTFADFYRATFMEMTRRAFLLTGSAETRVTWCRTRACACTGSGTASPNLAPTSAARWKLSRASVCRDVQLAGSLAHRAREARAQGCPGCVLVATRICLDGARAEPTDGQDGCPLAGSSLPEEGRGVIFPIPVELIRLAEAVGRDQPSTP
jgi:hypothetical protein